MKSISVYGRLQDFLSFCPMYASMRWKADGLVAGAYVRLSSSGMKHLVIRCFQGKDILPVQNQAIYFNSVIPFFHWPLSCKVWELHLGTWLMVASGSVRFAVGLNSLFQPQWFFDSMITWSSLGVRKTE